jgi:hypothetical protein
MGVAGATVPERPVAPVKSNLLKDAVAFGVKLAVTVPCNRNCAPCKVGHSPRVPGVCSNETSISTS